LESHTEIEIVRKIYAGWKDDNYVVFRSPDIDNLPVLFIGDVNDYKSWSKEIRVSSLLKVGVRSGPHYES
jgi:hypothetical protein